jgi:hypothetical protein
MLLVLNQGYVVGAIGYLDIWTAVKVDGVGGIDHGVGILGSWLTPCINKRGRFGKAVDFDIAICPMHS